MDMFNQKSCSVYDVFTPSKSALLTFVERNRVNDKIVDALRTPGKQLVIYGHTGSGKTTLLVNKLRQLYHTHITTLCMVGMTLEQLILDAFDQLNPYFTEERTSATKHTISSSVKSEYLAISGSLSAEYTNTYQTKKKRALPPQLTMQRLARFLSEADCPWVLEDFHKADKSVRMGLAQAMKVFVDSASFHSEVKIIAVGAVNTARQVVAYDSEMRNRIAEIYVPLMSNTEIKKIITKGSGLINIEINPEVINDIVKYSKGLAAVTHQLCLHSCVSAGIYETLSMPSTLGGNIFDIAITRYLEDEIDTIKSIFEKVMYFPNQRKYDHYSLILRALSSDKGHEGQSKKQIICNIRRLEPNYQSRKLTAYLEQLCSKDRDKLLEFNKISGVYSFSNPLYNSLATILFSNRDSWKKLLEGAESLQFKRSN